MSIKAAYVITFIIFNIFLRNFMKVYGTKGTSSITFV